EHGAVRGPAPTAAPTYAYYRLVDSTARCRIVKRSVGIYKRRRPRLGEGPYPTQSSFPVATAPSPPAQPGRPVRRVYIPKPGRPKERRPLGIPRVRDRVAQTAARLVLEPIFEASFLPCSFGFRPKRTAHQALERIRKDVNGGAQWGVEVDFKDFFGGLDRDLLL